MPRIVSDPDSGAARVTFAVRRKGFFPDTDALKKELAKKYPVEKIQIRLRNPVPHDLPYNVVILIYLFDKYVGPDLKKVINHARKLLIMQMDEKFRLKPNKKLKKREPRNTRL